MVIIALHGGAAPGWDPSVLSGVTLLLAGAPLVFDAVSVNHSGVNIRWTASLSFRQPPSVGTNAEGAPLRTRTYLDGIMETVRIPNRS